MRQAGFVTAALVLTVSAAAQAPPETVAVPDVVGRIAKDAAPVFAEAKLKARWIANGRAQRGDDRWKILRVTPEPGSLVPPGTEVTVEYLDEMTVVVPNVVGLTAKQAGPRLTAIGLRPRWIPAGRASDARDDWKIMRTGPAPDTSAVFGSEIAVEYLDAFRTGVLVPYLIGRFTQEAEPEILRKQLRAEWVPAGAAQRAEDSFRVVNVTPTPGILIPAGAVVRVEFLTPFPGGTPPPHPFMPSLISSPVDNARTVVGAIETRPAIEWRLAGPAPLFNLSHTVARQSIRPYSPVPPGSTVVVEYFGPYAPSGIPAP